MHERQTLIHGSHARNSVVPSRVMTKFDASRGAVQAGMSAALPCALNYEYFWLSDDVLALSRIGQGRSGRGTAGGPAS